jgi:hypothetical protein
VKQIRKRYANPFRSWQNIGGQLVPEEKLEELMRRVEQGAIDSWDKLHSSYDRLFEAYPRQKASHALFCLLHSHGLGLRDLSPELIRRALSEAAQTAGELLERAYSSRRKDFENPFRRTTFRSAEEMEAVWGKLEDISFLKSFTEEIRGFQQGVQRCLSALA